MNEPKIYAVIGEDGSVENVIWLLPSNRSDFPNAIDVADKPIAIGDAYIDGEFWRGGEMIISPQLPNMPPEN